MNYRIVKIASFYRDYLIYYYKQNPEVETWDYQNQFKHLMSQGYAWSNYFQIYLNELGNDAHEIVYNAEPLQKAWARENGISNEGDILFEQLKSLKPDVVLIQDMRLFTSDYLQKIRNEIKSVRKIIGHCCSPFTSSHLSIFRNYDFVLACSPQFVNILTENGIKNHLFYHGFEHTHVPKLSVDNSFSETEILFIGSFLQNKDFHDDRLKLVEHLVSDNLPLTIFTSLYSESEFWLKSKQLSWLLAKSMKSVGLAELSLKLPLLKKVALLNEMPDKVQFSANFIKHVINRPVFGLEMLKAVSKSRIGLNFHGGVAGDYAANVRLFEVTGTGSLLVTDNKKNMAELFKLDEEAIVFDTFDECVDKLNYLLANPENAKQIALAGQKRTLKDHSLQNRANHLHSLISQELLNK
jgi:spore maturation protein CgeB